MLQSLLQKRLFLQLYLFGCCCVVLLLVAPTGTGQSMFQSVLLELQLGEERVCHYETITLVCKHPDLNVQRDDGQYHFTTGIPTWKQDGKIITVDSDVYSISHTNRTHTHLIVAPDSMSFNTSLTFTCFVSPTEGTAVHSNIVTVDPGLRSPLPPQITSIAANYWSATIYWVHNTTCFEHCEFLVELGNFIATTKATSIRIDRLKPGQRYKVDVTAQCTSRAPSHELRGSTKGTREFQTEVAGKSLSLELQLEERVCHYETISLVCKHPNLNDKRDDGQYHFITGTPTWKQDGEIITVDSVVYSINHANRTHTHLSVAPDSMNSNTSLTFTCFVNTTEGTAVHSNIVTVYPGLNSPLPPQFTTIAPNYWTAAIYWVHNATCFKHCEFLVELGNFTATTKATSIRIDRLKPGQRYKVDVTAQCTSRAPSHELRVSTKGTREFKTKDGPITLSLTAANNIACVGKTFILNCSHPPLDAMTSAGEYIFVSRLPTWKINRKILTLDGSRFRATYLPEAGSLLEVSFDKFPSFSLNQIFNFTCAVRLHNHTVVSSEEVSIRATEFPVQFHLGMGHSNFTIDWSEYSICVPNKATKQGRKWFQVVLVPVNVKTNQEEWIKKRQDFTTDFNYTFSKLDSTYAYKVIVSLQSDTNDDNLEVTTNQTPVCLGDYYCLFCVSQEPFGDICDHSTAEWHRRIGRDVDRIVRNDSTHTILLPSDTAVVLKFLITNQTQTYYCRSSWCMSNVVSVGEDNITDVTSPIIENITARTRCINLTWSHNKTCCTNGKYTVSWQSEEASTHANKSGSIMISPAEHHLSITLLKPGTMYKVTVSVKCQRYEPKNATVSINTTTIPPTIAEATNDTVDTHPMLTVGEVLTLTCSAMGTPRPQIDWYNGDSRITTSSRVQINETEFGDSTLVSTLVIPSVTVGDAGTYECQAENSAGSTSLQYSVVVIGDGGDGGSGISGGAIAGIVTGLVAGLVVIIISAGVVIAILAVLRKKMKKEENHSGEKTVPTKPGATN